MRIISQNKTVSVNFENVNLLIDGNMIFFRDIGQARNEKSMLLGEYATENRAREVFDGIHKFYEAPTEISGNLLVCMPEK